MKEDHCRKGTYADSETKICELCKFQFCSECKNKDECMVCMKGFEKDESGKCVESRNFLSIIGPKPILISSLSKIQTKRFSRDLNSVGVGSDSI